MRLAWLIVCLIAANADNDATWDELSPTPIKTDEFVTTEGGAEPCGADWQPSCKDPAYERELDRAANRMATQYLNDERLDGYESLEDYARANYMTADTRWDDPALKGNKNMWKNPTTLERASAMASRMKASATKGIGSAVKGMENTINSGVERMTGEADRKRDASVAKSIHDTAGRNALQDRRLQDRRAAPMSLQGRRSNAMRNEDDVDTYNVRAYESKGVGKAGGNAYYASKRTGITGASKSEGKAGGSY